MAKMIDYIRNSKDDEFKSKFTVIFGSSGYHEYFFKLFSLIEDELRDRNEFEAWSDWLQGADIRVADFEETIDACGEGDFIFADPPYTVNHNSNGFIEYNEKIFGWSDQVRLHDCLLRAAQRGARFALTNADHPTVHELYEGCALQTVERGSEMAGDTRARGKTTEVVITSSVN